MRIRSNLKQGTITDNPLTNVATTINSANFANLPVVASPDTMVITLDPYQIGGAPEIVLVTGHTSASTTITVVRAQEGTIARQHNTGIDWVHTASATDFNPEFSTDLTSSGPPTTGTWETGREYYDGQGVAWLCSVGGTPGSWLCCSPGAIIAEGYAYETIGSTATTLATAVDTGLVITPQSTGSHEIEIECVVNLQSVVSGNNAYVSVCDITPGTGTPAATNEILRLLTTTAGVYTLVSNKIRLTPPAGIRTIKAYLWCPAGTEARLSSDALTWLQPMRLTAKWS